MLRGGSKEMHSEGPDDLVPRGRNSYAHLLYLYGSNDGPYSLESLSLESGSEIQLEIC